MGFHFNKAQKRQKASNGARDHDRLSGEYRSTGGGGNEPNGSKAIPAGPHSQMQNGGQKHHGHTGGAGGAFEGARSPPGTKSERARPPTSFPFSS